MMTLGDLERQTVKSIQTASQNFFQADLLNYARTV